MDLSPIGLPAQTLAHLELTRWNLLAAEERDALLEFLTQQFQFHGLRFLKPRLEHHGPSQEQIVAIWLDETTGLEYALIPGGTLAPGYNEAQLERYAHIYHLIEAWRDEVEEDFDAEEQAPADAEDSKAETPGHTFIFAGKKPCDIRRKLGIRIEPFLMAVTPLLINAPSISDIAPKPDWWTDVWKATDRRLPDERLQWPHVEAVLRYYSVALPTSAEYEWALSGGLSSLFYWGDEIPDWVIDAGLREMEEAEDDGEEVPGRRIAAAFPAAETDAERGVTSRIPFYAIMLWRYDPDKPRRWPYCNRFGLIGMTASAAWCEPAQESGDPYPLVVRGGAADNYPWQACGEWKSLLNAAERRMDEETTYASWNALRPVIRLQAQV